MMQQTVATTYVVLHLANDAVEKCAPGAPQIIG
jgi:hypothetical protein